jgi:thymidylate synthase
VIKELSADKDSRRAIITILQPYHTNKSKIIDCPCTQSLNFRIRNNRLNMTVKMRSQDAYFGMASDVPIFSFIHEMIYIKLKNTYKDLLYGDYYHSVDSFHLYKNRYEFLNDLNIFSKFDEIKCPKISSSEEVDFIRQLPNITSDILIPGSFRFTKWLYTLQ